MDLSMIGILLFFGAATIGLLTLHGVVLERHQVFKSLRNVRTIELRPTDVRSQELALPFAQRVLVPALRWIGGLGRRFAPSGVLERLGKELAYAGSPAGWDAERVFAAKMLGIAGLAVGGGVLARIGGLAAAKIVLLTPILAVLGYYLPEWVLRSKSGRRQQMLQRALPDALDLLSITVEAGLGFDAALARVARSAGGPLGEEFHRVLQEMQIGKSRAEALRDLGERSTVPELRSFVLAMVQADVFGISVGKVLHVQAAEMRLKRRQRAEEKAQKVPVKIIFPLIACIFPSLFVVLLGPAAMAVRSSLFKG